MAKAYKVTYPTFLHDGRTFEVEAVFTSRKRAEKELTEYMVANFQDCTSLDGDKYLKSMTAYDANRDEVYASILMLPLNRELI